MGEAGGVDPEGDHFGPFFADEVDIGFSKLAPADFGDGDVLGGVVALDLIFQTAVVRAEVNGVVALAIGADPEGEAREAAGCFSGTGHAVAGKVELDDAVLEFDVLQDRDALAIGGIAGSFIGEAGGGTAFKAYLFNGDVTRQQIGRARGLRGEQDGAGEAEKSKLHFSRLGALCE